MTIVFGPVPSRRLGRSLGIDLVPFKTCTYDCIYCQLGRTTNETDERRAWVDIDRITRELEDKLETAPDYITLGGSGEPTLHSGIGELIARIKDISDIPIAVLTNGSLLWRDDVREELSGASLVIPSLDAGDQETFEAVNRPIASISYREMVEGIASFTHAYTGECLLEVFIVEGVNSRMEDAKKIADAVKSIRPAGVQLNTVSRPPAEPWAVRTSMDRLEDIARLFDPPAEVIADHPPADDSGEHAASEESIIELLRRRPCTIDDISRGLGIHMHEVIKHVNNLTRRGVVHTMKRGDVIYYGIAQDA